jgi:hypothetical protein
MRFDAIGIHPENAVNIVVKLYDEQPTENKKIKLLTSNNTKVTLNSKTIDERFKSGQTIDINPGELIGLGLVASYYNHYGQRSGNTYQVVTGVEDSVKAQSENVLSDGAIWHNQTKQKMLFQTVMFQGYHPKQPVTTERIIEQINLKSGIVRDRYPDNCGLIVNMFAEVANFDLKRIAAESNYKDYTDVYLVGYKLPALDFAYVFRLDEKPQPTLTVRLNRNSIGDDWNFNYSDSTRKNPSN